MLTPTNVTKSEYINAIKNDAQSHARITFIGQNIVLTDEDIESSGIVLNDYLNGETILCFGKAVSRELSIPIINSSKLNGIIWNSELKYEIGIEINGDTEWITVGYFLGNRPSKTMNVEVIEFNAIDKMQKFDIVADSWLDSITYPKTVWQLFTSLCDFVGVGYESGDELANMKTRSFSSAPIVTRGTNCREILSKIAEAFGCYAKINAKGKCQMVWFSDHTSEYTLTEDDEFSVSSFDNVPGKTWAELESFKWEELENLTWSSLEGTRELFRIHAISVKSSDDADEVNYPNITNGNTYYIIGNPFLATSNATQINNYIKPIFDRLASFGGYVPSEIVAVGNCLVETGDIINVTSHNVTYAMPVFIKSSRWNGSCTDQYECTGDIDNVTTLPTDVKERLNESGKNREIIIAIGNKYDKISGIEITPDGIEIEGNKYVKVKSGGVFTVESGNFNVDSNGNVYMKGTAQVPLLRKGLLRSDPEPLRDDPVQTGGSFTTESGNFTIDTSGNVEMKGDVEISAGKNMTVKSGGDLTIESGGNLNVESGGQIDIDATGNLKLEGSTVEIKSGSTFDVDSTNFTINSAAKRITTGDWKLFQNGLVKKYYHDYLQQDIGIAFGDYPAFMEDNIEVVGFTSNIAKSVNYNYGIMYLTMKYTDESFGRIIFEVNKEGARISADNGQLHGGTLTNIPGTLGSNDGLWDIWGDDIHYNYLVQNSSKDIKHDIQPMPDQGEKLDRLQPVSFVYDNDKQERKRMGLIYEDTVDVMPEICTNDESNKAINYVELIPILLKEIQDLRARVKQLEEREEN